MLVLTRLDGQRIVIGSGPRRIVITLIEGGRGRAKIGVAAPRDIQVLREELIPQAAPAPPAASTGDDAECPQCNNRRGDHQCPACSVHPADE